MDERQLCGEDSRGSVGGLVPRAAVQFSLCGKNIDSGTFHFID